MSLCLNSFREPFIPVYLFKYVVNRCKCNIVKSKIAPEKRPKGNKYSHTVLLPKTDFPMRVSSANKVDSDEYIFKTCKFAELYEWQRKYINGPEFILHDGPPYANGKPHMGHAINKILKDITIRHKLLQGHKVHYIPGWDCHGLPIELKALAKEDGIPTKNDAINIRCKARKFASEAIENQLKTFKSWGIMADWNKCYFTFSKDYIKNQFDTFFSLYNEGYIYRDMKPVYWSPSSRTALAEAELEYNESHVSKAVILGLYVAHLPDSLNSKLTDLQNVRVLVWTTTPWSLPANQAVCYHPEMTYCFAKPFGSSHDVYLLAVDCLKNIQEKLNVELEIMETFPGRCLEGAQYKHPIVKNQHLSFLPGLHVSSGVGTGLVHTAPSHGHDDFVISLKYELPQVDLVDEAGRYTSEAGSDLQGLSVLSEGNTLVLEKVKHLILQQEDYIHSYPYDWRTKEPIIIKASLQWFIDTDAIKTKALKLLNDVNVYPNKLQNQSALVSQLQKRPYWCISRQRVWGVPIPVLLNKRNGSPAISRDLIDHYNELLNEHGPDFWWTLPNEMIAPERLIKNLGLSPLDVEKGKDILDIWFDSGISWSFVLENKKQADLYLEGLDQFTGWFQSSLMTSVALQEKTPYKSIFVHGFAVDEFGYKMSKSVGNVVDPQDITKGNGRNYPAFGVDTLRWWVASHGTQNTSIPISKSIMESSASEVQKVRIVSRFLLGAIWDFTKDHNSLPLDNLLSFDLWMLNKLMIFEDEVFAMYNLYQYHNVCKAITNFVTNEVSAVYCHLIKDRLYCAKKDDRHRIACQFVLKHVLETLSRVGAPILPFLMEEVYLHHPCKDEELIFHSKPKKVVEQWCFPEAVSRIETALKTKEIINKMYSSNTLKLAVQIQASGKEFLQLKELADHNELNELLQVSSSDVIEGSKGIEVSIETSSGKLCDRCRRFTSPLEDALCPRCEEVTKVSARK